MRGYIHFVRFSVRVPGTNTHTCLYNRSIADALRCNRVTFVVRPGYRGSAMMFHPAVREDQLVAGLAGVYRGVKSRRGRRLSVESAVSLIIDSQRCSFINCSITLLVIRNRLFVFCPMHCMALDIYKIISVCARQRWATN